MDLGFEKTRQVQNALHGGGDRSRSPDWRGLRARLFAVRAARHVLEAQAFQTDSFTGCSFDHGSAILLSTYGNGLSAVNPTALGNCKPDGVMNADVAGANGTGDRGCR